MQNQIISALEKYTKSVAQKDNLLVLNVDSYFSEGEKFSFVFNEDNIVFSHHLGYVLAFRNIIFSKTIPFVVGDDEAFILDDVLSAVSSYISAQEAEFDYAIDGDKAQRVSILKQVAKIKRHEIEDLEKELSEYQEKISPVMIEETKLKGFELQDVVVLKDDARSINLKQGKKYYINEMVPMFKKDWQEGIDQHRPFVHFTVGRIKTDGFSYNYNIIGEDNSMKDNKDSKFVKASVTVKNRFAEKYPNINNNTTTFILNNPEEFPELDDAKILKHHTITYGNTFFSNQIGSYKRKLNETFGDKEFSVKEFLIEFSVKGQRYMYISIDNDKNFIVGKKRVSELLKMVEDKDPNIVPLPDNYENLRLSNKDSDDYYEGQKSFSTFLYPFFEKAVEAK